MRGRLGVVLVTLAVVVGLAGCAQEPEPVATVTVTGEPGAAPVLEYPTPLEVSGNSVEVIAEGTGPRLVDGKPVLVDFHAESGADGSLINETYSSEPRPYLLSAEALGTDIYEALSGKRVGSRILQVVAPTDGQTAATVVVYDILPTRATGTDVELRDGLPVVSLGADGAPTVTVPDLPAPTDLVVQPLIRGSGPQVTAGQVITVQFVGLTWSTGTVFDSTWTAGRLPASFPIGVESVIEGWDSGLVEQPVGSQVLLVVPPELAYGGAANELSEDTLVFVVDILSAVGGPTVEEP